MERSCEETVEIVPLRIDLGGRDCFERGYVTFDEFNEMFYGKKTGETESPIAKNTRNGNF